MWNPKDWRLNWIELKISDKKRPQKCVFDFGKKIYEWIEWAVGFHISISKRSLVLLLFLIHSTLGREGATLSLAYNFTRPSYFVAPLSICYLLLAAEGKGEEGSVKPERERWTPALSKAWSELEKEEKTAWRYRILNFWNPRYLWSSFR